MRLALRLAFGFATVTPSAALAADVATLPHNLSPWGMFVSADIVVKAVMIGLAFASLVTWTVWLAKLIELRQASRCARQRLAHLEAGQPFQEQARSCAADSDAVALLIRSAANEVLISQGLSDDGVKERVALVLDRTEQTMARRMSRGTGLLATIGATAPFVGLFGTVWGIMNAFIGISEARTTNLAVVAPGIAEALLATALGLVAAIPAVVVYNQLVRAITNYRALLGDASAQLLLIASREQDRVTAGLQRAAE